MSINRTVEVPAKGKREAFSFDYQAPTAKEFAESLKTPEGLKTAYEAFLSHNDSLQIIEHTTAAKESAMLASTFEKSLKYLAKAMGNVDKALPILMSSGGFETLTEDEVNAAVDHVKNPPARKPRTKKADSPVAA